MDERSFVKSNQESWNQLTATLEQVRARGIRSLSTDQLESVGGAYRAVVSDLAFARSQGASQDLLLYLNDLAGRAHGLLYSSPSSRLRSTRLFFFAEFPRLVRSTWRYSVASLLLFAAGWMLALYILYAAPELNDMVVPRDLKEVPDPAKISSFIMTNNIREGMVAFVGGITFGALTVFTLFKNGLIIGGVLTVAFAKMNPVTLLSLLLPHGFIELTAIFICGGAGLIMGCALIAPGNLRRVDAIRLASGTAIKLFAGTLPFFVVAAIIEGFITPAAIPAFAKLAFSGVTLLGLVAYIGFGGRDGKSHHIKG